MKEDVHVASNVNPTASSIGRCEPAEDLDRGMQIKNLYKVLSLGVWTGRGADLPTVFLEKFQDGYVFMSKPDPSTPWRSQYNGLEGAAEGVSMQGDPRTPIAMLGLELAYEFGFRAEFEFSGAVIVRAPGPQRTEEKAVMANRKLKEPISSIPIKTGVMSPEEIVQLARKVRGDFIFLSAFEPEDSRITVHEASFHFSILISKKIAERANSISIFTLDFVDYLREHRDEHGPLIEIVAQKIMDQRYLELDAGVGSLVTTLARVRGLFNLRPYAECWRKLAAEDSELFKTYRERIISAVRYLTLPELSLVKALHLQSIKDQLIDPKRQIAFDKIVEDFLADRPSYSTALINDKCESADVWTNEFVLGLDARIEEIMAACEG